MKRHGARQQLKDEIKAQEIDEHNAKIARDLEIVQAEHETKQKHKEMIFEELQRQMHERKEQNEVEFKDSKKFFNTNGGPGITADVQVMKDNFELVRNRENKEFLR